MTLYKLAPYSDYQLTHSPHPNPPSTPHPHPRCTGDDFICILVNGIYICNYFSNCNGATIEAREKISNLIPRHNRHDYLSMMWLKWIRVRKMVLATDNSALALSINVRAHIPFGQKTPILSFLLVYVSITLADVIWLQMFITSQHASEVEIYERLCYMLV